MFALKVIDFMRSYFRKYREIYLALAFYLFTLSFLPVQASKINQLSIEGDWVQGAMLRGKTHPRSSVEVLGRSVVIDTNGEFVFGLGRDAPKEVSVVLTNQEGEVVTKSYSVKQRDYRTQSIEGVAQKYVAPPERVSKRIKKDASLVWSARQSSKEHDGWTHFIWPAEGRISGVYGSQRIFNGVPKRPHYGLDIANKTGEPVYAPASGEVTLAHPDLYYSGGTIIVAHGLGISSTFIHLSKLHVDLGQFIKQGELIGEIGSSGRATGPHLDWRVNWFGQRLDPQLLVPERSAISESTSP